MFLTILPCTLKIVTIILSFFDKKSKKQYSENFKRVDDNLEILYVPYPWLIPIGLFIYFGMKIMRAYIKTYIKWYMDIKYISITKLLMLYGIIGTIFYTIICTITTFAKCSEAKINDYFCQTKDDKDHKYFANFSLYFTEILFKYPLQEIILLIIGILGFSFYKFFSLMIIKNLTPIHLVFSLPLFYIMRKIILAISFFFNHPDFEDIYMLKYILDDAGDVLCIFAYFIYLEIIELHCCNLNFNLSESIITRGQTELCSKEDLINDDEESSIDRGETKNSLSSI
jgi:hypothetical protein